ncbi:MAG: hypothetical protein FWE23_04880 [Chitinivibrionia bacterium]|nr:hypothetical protein [Chitinivibrionia bacterium]
MIKIATLGPERTFSDKAAQKYLEKHPNLQAQIVYVQTITNVFEELSAQNCDLGVVPAENSTKTQGIVKETQVALKNFKVSIIDDLVLPVKLSFFSKAEPSQIKKIFVKEEAQNQCLKFLSEYSSNKIIHTDSNIDSFKKLNEDLSLESAAVVPSHLFEEYSRNYKFCVKNITDEADNRTRFLVLKKSDETN